LSRSLTHRYITYISTTSQLELAYKCMLLYFTLLYFAYSRSLEEEMNIYTAIHSIFRWSLQLRFQTGNDFSLSLSISISSFRDWSTGEHNLSLGPTISSTKFFFSLFFFHFLYYPPAFLMGLLLSKFLHLASKNFSIYTAYILAVFLLRFCSLHYITLLYRRLY
jgi:hypothetical protein